MNRPFKIWVEDKETLKKVLAKMEKEGILWRWSKDSPCIHRMDVPVALYVYEDNLLSHSETFTYFKSHSNNEVTPEEYLKENNVMRDKFTKDDLKDWMIVETVEHSIFLVDKTHGYLIHSGGHMSLASYTDDLKCLNSYSTLGEYDHDYSIVKVYEPKHGFEFFLKLYLDGTIKDTFCGIEEDLNLIWERDEESVEMTIAEIEEKLGIKNLKIVKEKEDE